MKTELIAGLIVTALFAVSARAAETNGSAAAQKIEPVLRPDPAVMAKLAALGDNSSCVLERKGLAGEEIGDFAKGRHNMKKAGPCSRDFSTKMAWMPDRKRAFFCGANHGSPHRFNDAWEFDLPSCTWVLLYAPDYNDRGAITEYDKKVLVMDKGWLRTRKGGPAHPGHTWSGLTYDPKIKGAVWFNYWPPYRMGSKLKAIGAKSADLYKGPPVWVFYPYKKKWEPLPTAKPWPRSKAAGSMEYIPELGGSLWMMYSSFAVLDAKQRKWKRQSPAGGFNCYSTLVCYDPGRKLLVAHNGLQRGPGRKGNSPPNTYHGSVVAGSLKKWQRVASLPPDAAKKWRNGHSRGAQMPPGHEINSAMYFDPVGKVALNYVFGTRSIWSYDPDTKKWTKQAHKGPRPPFGGRERILSYMDLARNVFVVVGNNKVWCYRYRTAGKKTPKT